MKALLGLLLVFSVIHHSSSAFPTKTTEAAQAMTTLTLRELLTTYQRLYERQFHEPLPDSQKVLLASLPRFEKPTIPGRISHASALDEPRSFQQDDDSKREENEVTTEEEDFSTVEPKELASTTTTSAVRTTEEDDSSEATAVSPTLTPAPEKEEATTAATPTAADPKKRLKGPANDAQQNQTAPVKEEAVLKKETLKNAPEEELPGAAAFPSNAAVTNVVKKVEAMPMETVNVMPSTANDVPKKAVSQPSKLDAPLVRKEQLNSVPRIPEQNPRFSAPSTPVEAVLTHRGHLPKAVPDAEVAFRAPFQPLQSLPQERPMQEFTQTAPLRSVAEPGAIPARIPKVHTVRTDPDSTRHFVPKQLPSRPAPRMQSKPQPINLEVMNHVVVPRGPISGPPQQSRRVNGQVRTRQPLRRQQPPVRAPPPVRPAPEVNLPIPPPPKTFQKPTNLIVIQDGRVIDLTPQQQRDLSLVLSSMVTANETGARRRAPTRRTEPIVNNRGPRNQFFSDLH